MHWKIESKLSDRSSRCKFTSILMNHSIYFWQYVSIDAGFIAAIFMITEIQNKTDHKLSNKNQNRNMNEILWVFINILSYGDKTNFDYACNGFMWFLVILSDLVSFLSFCDGRFHLWRGMTDMIDQKCFWANWIFSMILHTRQCPFHHQYTKKHILSLPLFAAWHTIR